MDKFNENIELTLAKRGIRKKELITALGISRSAFYAKLAGVRPWLLGEAVAVADFLGVSICDLL